jgi:hypothetical protein
MPKAAQNVPYPKEQNGNIVVTLAKGMLNPYAEKTVINPIAMISQSTRAYHNILYTKQHPFLLQVLKFVILLVSLPRIS